MSQILRSLLLLVAAALLPAASGCASAPKQPVPSLNADAGVAIHGYDPVAYFTRGEPTPGDPAITRRHAGALFRFASEEHRRLFDADPERYLPQYGGYCAIAMSWDRIADVDPHQWKVVDGRLFLNNSAFAHALFQIGESGNVRRADANWAQYPRAAQTPEAGRSAAARAVAAPDRSEADRALDAGRQPVAMLEFFGIDEGMRVLELAAGGGYTSELLARTVGPAGTVYGQNSAFLLQRFAERPWSERLQKPAMRNVVRLDRPFEDPFPADLRDLDAVLIVLFYHDLYWQEVDRERLNRAVHRALRPGGVYGIVDHSGRPGTGSSEAKTLHRVEEALVRSEVEAAGFRLDAEGSFLRNPDDPRDWNAAPSAAGERRGSSDRFVLRFVKEQETGAAP